MTVADEALDSLAVEGLDPAEVFAELFLVDAVVIVEGDGNSGENGLESLNLSHDDISFSFNHNLKFVSVSASCVSTASRAGVVRFCKRLLLTMPLYHG